MFGKFNTFLKKSALHVFRNKGRYGVSIIAGDWLLEKIEKRQENSIEIGQINPAEKSAIRKPDSKLMQIRNLVFQGGGPKGIAYVGALELLKENLGENFDEIERVAGTSAGAITATLLSVGYTPEQIKDLLNQTSPKYFLLDNDRNTDSLVTELAEACTAESYLRTPRKAIGAAILRPLSTYHLVVKFHQKKGVCSGENFRKWLEEAISSKVSELEGGNKEEFQYLTFGQLKELTDKNKGKSKRYKELSVVGARFDVNSNLDKPNIYSTENPKMANYIISDAVRVSMSIPFLFTPHNLYYRDQSGNRIEIETTDNIPGGIDGGLLRNYPIEIFDLNKYLSEPFLDKLPNEKLVNLETLGFTLYRKTHVSFTTWFRRTLGAIRNMRSKNLEPFEIHSLEDITRDIAIDNCGVSTFAFDIPKPKTDTLIKSGRKFVEQFLSDGSAESLRSKQEEESQKKRAVFEKILSGFLNHEKSNLILKLPSEDYIKTRYTDKLDKAVSKPFSFPPILVRGIGGVGKTTLITGYFYNDYFKKYILENWKKGKLYDRIEKPIVQILERITNDKEAYVKDFSEFARTILNKKELNFSSQDKDIIRQVFSKLEEGAQWLIVFDDCTNSEQIQTFVDVSKGFKKGKIIVSSRNSDLMPEAQAITMIEFNSTECRALIDRIKLKWQEDENTGDFSPSDDPQSIITLSCGIPLYLKVAVTRVYGYQIPTYSEYAKRLEDYESANDVSIKDSDKSLGIKKSQKAILLESIQAIRLFNEIANPNFELICNTGVGMMISPNISKNADGNDAYRVLQLCSYISERDIPDELIKKYIERVIGKKGVSLFQNIMRIISTTSLISRTRYSKNTQWQLYQIHAITQHYIREMTEKEDINILNKLYSTIWESIRGVLSAGEFIDPNFSGEKTFCLFVHLNKLLNNYPQTPYPSDELEVALGSINYQIGMIWNQFYGDVYSKSLGFFKEAHRLLEKYCKPADLISLDIELADSYNGTGQPDETFKYLEEARFIIEKEQIKDRSLIADLTQSLARYYFIDRGNYQKAKEKFDETLALLQSEEDELEKHNTCLAELACLHIFLGNPETAENIILGIPNYNKVRDIILILSAAKLALGDLDDARKLASSGIFKSASPEHFKSAQEEFGEKFGNAYYTLGHDLPLLPKLYLMSGDKKDINEANYILKEMFKIKKSRYGLEHIKTANIESYLGESYRDLGDLNNARQHLEHALKIQQSYYSKDHIIPVKTLIRLCDIEIELPTSSLSDVKQVKEILEKSRKILEEFYYEKEEQTEIALNLFTLSKAHLKLENLQESCSLGREAYEIFNSRLGTRHRYTRDVLSYLQRQGCDLAGLTYRPLVGNQGDNMLTFYLGKRRLYRNQPLIPNISASKKSSELTRRNLVKPSKGRY